MGWGWFFLGGVIFLVCVCVCEEKEKEDIVTRSGLNFIMVIFKKEKTKDILCMYTNWVELYTW